MRSLRPSYGVRRKTWKMPSYVWMPMLLEERCCLPAAMLTAVWLMMWPACPAGSRLDGKTSIRSLHSMRTVDHQPSIISRYAALAQ